MKYIDRYFNIAQFIIPHYNTDRLLCIPRRVAERHRIDSRQEKLVSSVIRK